MPNTLGRYRGPIRRASRHGGYIFDSDSGDWHFTCVSCGAIIYAPTLNLIREQYIRHSLIRPLERRTCPVIY